MDGAYPISEMPGHNNGDGRSAAAKKESTSLEKVQQFLKAKDDTSRFVGLALLKSVLDNSPELQGDEGTITLLWNSISPKFLDRLLRTGSQAGSGQENSKDMLDLAVAVLHTSKETSGIIIETLLTLVSSPEGARIFAGLEVDDWIPLIEVAPEQPHVLSILVWAWERGTASSTDQRSKVVMKDKIDKSIQSLVASFAGTDATSLLEFLSHLGNLDAELIPQNPKWLSAVTKFIRSLSTNRPTAAGRSAYTKCAGTILMLYPSEASQLLFSDEPGSEKSFSYLFINLILVDLRATLPSLLEKLNDPEYPQITRRLASALDILAAFIGHLIAWIEELDDDDTNANAAGASAGEPKPTPTFLMPPDLILKLSKSIGETISVTMEYLRDRWDASVAGAPGLHPEARAGAAHTSAGSHRTLAWDAKDYDDAAADPFTLSALRAIALWLRDDDGDALRTEAAGLMDMLMELYQGGGDGGQDYRLPILAALEGILRTERGIEAFNAHDGWSVISRDLLSILSATATTARKDGAEDRLLAGPPEELLLLLRGTRAALVLSIVAEAEPGSTPEGCMALVTAVAAYGGAEAGDVEEGGEEEGVEQQQEKRLLLLEFQTDVLRLAASLLANASPGMRRRYAHSADAIRGIALRLRRRAGGAGEESKGKNGNGSAAAAAAASDLDEVLAILQF
ncbi:hypothetical protein SLS62_011429 [Diatrype stigma]|uniref:Neurochondrin n=1 Tax=Diatrype stigma TaxID=117547 RepID=A0AAN9UBI5_9PEZI